MTQALEAKNEKNRGEKITEFDEVGLPVHSLKRPIFVLWSLYFGVLRLCVPHNYEIQLNQDIKDRRSKTKDHFFRLNMRSMRSVITNPPTTFMVEHATAT